MVRALSSRSQDGSRQGTDPPRSWLVRAAGMLGLLLWLGASFMVALAFVASWVLGWAFASVLVLIGAVPLLRRFIVAGWAAATVIGGVLALTLGLLAYELAVPGHGRLRSVASDVGTDVTGWQLVTSGQSGNTWCWQGCPEVGYYYVTAQPPASAIRRFTLQLKADEWVRLPLRDPTGQAGTYAPIALQIWEKDEWRVSVRVPSPSSPLASWRRGTDPSLTPIEVLYTSMRS